jgi:hypothetical protein
MNRTVSFSVSSFFARVAVAVSLGALATGCAAAAADESESDVRIETTSETSPQTREHILLARQVGVPSIAQDDATRDITAAPGGTACGGGTCTETPDNSCDGFRKSCSSQAGCGTTSTGAGDIAVVSCIAIPTPR